jgi:hypothetical protein
MDSKFDDGVSSLTNLFTKNIILERMLIREYNLFLMFFLTFFRLLLWFVSLLSINLQWHKRLFVFDTIIFVNVTCYFLSMGLGCSFDMTSFSLLNFSLEEGILWMIHSVMIGFIRATYNCCSLNKILRLRSSHNLLLIGTIIKVKTFANRILSCAWINKPSLLRTSGLHTTHLLWLYD